MDESNRKREKHKQTENIDFKDVESSTFLKKQSLLIHHTIDVTNILRASFKQEFINEKKRERKFKDDRQTHTSRHIDL